MKTWRENFNGYEFVLWNFDRFDINSSIWVKEAFEAKKYACAADYIRLFAIYNYGGIYMDMDVEAVKPFGDLLNRNIMLGYEDNEQRIEAGCFGAEKGHPFIKKCLDYHEREFNGPLVLPIIMRDILNESFSGENYDILPSEYFSAKSYVTGEVKKTKNTRTIHHYTGSWFTEKDRETMEKRWKHFSKFGNSVFSWILYIISDLPGEMGSWIIDGIKRRGFLPSLKYFWNTYITNKMK
jgi:mannosyltransferase OCH1-like enzyme